MLTGNHDLNRLCTEGRTDPEDLKVAMTFFLTMPGVPFIYYGDEIGLKQNPAAPSTDGSGFRAVCRILHLQTEKTREHYHYPCSLLSDSGVLI